MVQTASLHGTHWVRVGVWQCNPTVQDRVVCGTVYGNTHLKDLLGSIAILVGYPIPVPDFYLVLHGLRCRKTHYNELNHLSFCLTEFCSASIPFILLSDVFDSVTLDICDSVFQFVEEKVSLWKNVSFCVFFFHRIYTELCFLWWICSICQNVKAHMLTFYCVYDKLKACFMFCKWYHFLSWACMKNEHYKLYDSLVTIHPWPKS